MRHLHFSFYQKYATRISVCVIAVSKSQEFLLKVRRLSFFRLHIDVLSFFRRRRKRFDFNDESIFFSTTSDTNTVRTYVRMDRRTIETGFIRSTLKSPPKKENSKNRLLTTLNNVSEAKVTARTNAMNNKHQMIYLERLT